LKQSAANAHTTTTTTVMCCCVLIQARNVELEAKQTSLAAKHAAAITSLNEENDALHGHNVFTEREFGNRLAELRADAEEHYLAAEAHAEQLATVTSALAAATAAAAASAAEDHQLQQAAATAATAALQAKFDASATELAALKSTTAAAATAAVSSQNEMAALRAEVDAYKSTATAEAATAAATAKADIDKLLGELSIVKAQAAADAAVTAAVKDEKAALLATTQQQKLELQAAEVCIPCYTSLCIP
jgi:hypothetical protein